MKWMLFQTGLLLRILLFGWRSLDRLDGPPLGRAILVGFWVSYTLWLGLPWIVVGEVGGEWLWSVCALGLLLLWVWLPLAAEWRGLVRSPNLHISQRSGVKVEYRRSKFGPLVLRRRGRLHPVWRSLAGCALCLLILLLLAGVVDTQLHQQVVLNELLLIMLWVGLTLLMGVMLG